MPFKSIIFLLLWPLTSNAAPLENLKPRGEFASSELSFSTGMSLINYTEGASTLEGENVSTPESGSVSVISGFLNYKFSPEGRYHYSIGASFPLMSSSVGSYFDGNITMEYHFGIVNNRQGIKGEIGDVTVRAKLRYYVGGEVGFGYLTYSTTSAKKNDTTFNLGLIGGLTYDISEKWSLRFHTTAVRTTGVITTGMAIKGQFGAVYYLDD